MEYLATIKKSPLIDHSNHLLQKWLQGDASHPIKANCKNLGYPFHHFLYLLIIVFLSLTTATKAYPKDPYELVVGVRVDAPPFSSCSVAPSEESVTGDEEFSCPEVADKSDDNPDANSDIGRKYQGYTVDLCKRIVTRAVKEEGLYCSVTYKELTSKDRFELLKNKEIDLLCGATTVTLERLRVADFSLFTFLSGASLMYSASDDKKQKNSLNVGVLEKTTTREQVRDIISNVQQHQDYFKRIILQNVEVTPYSNHYAGLHGLLDEEIDAYIADREILLALQTRGEQILGARSKNGPSIWYVIFAAERSDKQPLKFEIGVLKKTLTKERARQIFNDQQQNEDNGHELASDEVEEYSNNRDGLLALENKEIQAFISDSTILEVLQKRDGELLQSQANDDTIRPTVDMKILLIPEKAEKSEDPEDGAQDGQEKTETDMKLIVLRDYFTVEPYAIGIKLGATNLRYVADKVLNEMYTWNPASGTSEIYTILQRSFPGKKFSKSIENMFRLQRVSVGKRVADEFLPRIPRAECKKQERSSATAEGTQLATSP